MMVLWELTRISALVAFGCYTISVVWGILLAARSFRPAAPALELHRWIAMLGLVAVLTHVGTLLADHYAKVNLLSLVGIDHRAGVTLGAIALWLVIALPLSFLLKRSKKISHKVWRGFHYFGYATWLMIALHAMISGTDTKATWGVAIIAAGAAIVGGAAAMRWLPAEEKPARDVPRAKDPRRRPTTRPVPVAAAASSRGDADYTDLDFRFDPEVLRSRREPSGGRRRS